MKLEKVFGNKVTTSQCWFYYLPHRLEFGHSSLLRVHKLLIQIPRYDTHRHM